MRPHQFVERRSGHFAQAWAGKEPPVSAISSRRKFRKIDSGAKRVAAHAAVLGAVACARRDGLRTSGRLLLPLADLLRKRRRSVWNALGRGFDRADPPHVGPSPVTDGLEGGL